MVFLETLSPKDPSLRRTNFLPLGYGLERRLRLFEEIKVLYS